MKKRDLRKAGPLEGDSGVNPGGSCRRHISIPAAEHSTVNTWSRDGEVEAYRNILKQYARSGTLVAFGSDSYDLWAAIEKMWGGKRRQSTTDSDATLVVHPDPGGPAEIVRESFWQLDAQFGSTTSSKQYNVLKDVRVIQGDAVNGHRINDVLAAAAGDGFSADNIAFGMGG